MTENQKKLLLFIKNYLAANSTPPSLREMAEGIGVSGVNSVSGIIDALVKKGLLVDPNGKSRSVILTEKGMRTVTIDGNKDKKVKISHEGVLSLGSGIEIPCYVLEDGTRILSGRGMQEALHMVDASDTGKSASGQRMARHLSQKSLEPFIQAKKALGHFEPIECYKGDKKINGYEATTLADICDVFLEARKNIKLSPRQEIIAQQCEILIRSFAKIGIIALVDEATGYQKQKNEYQKTIALYIAEEIRPWLKTFKDDYYEQLYKLLDWDWESFKKGKKNHPQLLGKITNALVYYKLPNGIIQELQRLNPKNEKGVRKVQHHRLLTENVGYRHLIEHLAQITLVARMYGRGQYQQAKSHIDSLFPDQRPNAQTALDIPIDIQEYESKSKEQPLL